MPKYVFKSAFDRGNIKDGKPDGYGMLKQGKFLGKNMKIFLPKLRYGINAKLTLQGPVPLYITENGILVSKADMVSSMTLFPVRNIWGSGTMT